MQMHMGSHFDLKGFFKVSLPTLQVPANNQSMAASSRDPEVAFGPQSEWEDNTRPSLGPEPPVAGARRRQGLRSFAVQVCKALVAKDTRSAPASVVARRLDMAELRAALRAAGMSAGSRIARLARGFPEIFELKTSTHGGAGALTLTTRACQPHSSSNHL